MGKVCIVNVADLMEENGKTIRQNNLEKTHKLPIGLHVRSNYLQEIGVITCHGRDCDGTPLYSINVEYHGLSEEDLVSLAQYLKG